MNPQMQGFITLCPDSYLIKTYFIHLPMKELPRMHVLLPDKCTYSHVAFILCRQDIAALPGVSRWGTSSVVDFLRQPVADGLSSVLLFGVPDKVNIQHLCLPIIDNVYLTQHMVTYSLDT